MNNPSIVVYDSTENPYTVHAQTVELEKKSQGETLTVSWTFG